jgi:hypothetical protein
MRKDLKKFSFSPTTLLTEFVVMSVICALWHVIIPIICSMFDVGFINSWRAYYMSVLTSFGGMQLIKLVIFIGYKLDFFL